MEPNPQNPFKGLRPYKQEDRDKLFGRDRDLILMKDRIFSGRTTLLFAGSGVGKTSFLNAKIIPEIKRQCVVVWHNRWTGADEDDGEESFSDERSFRWWPPRVFFRDLIRIFRRRREDEASEPKTTRPRFEQDEDSFEREVRKTITQSLQSSAPPTRKLSEFFARFRKSLNVEKAESDDQHKDRAILILDQFEEVFQYHAYEDYFSSFVNDLCQIINNDDYQVRVVFSMREEFLGELSIFDNKIPDLFNNYYRLKYPDKDEAEDIIRRTCELSGVSPDDKNLRNLVEDLSKIEKGSGSFAERATGSDKTKTRVIKRNFVAPPYLQIACERLWKQQYDSTTAAPTTAAVTNGSSTSIDQSSRFAPFLINYRPGVPSNEHEAGGDAQKALRDFCEEKLSPPYLNRSQQNIVARAFGFLVTKQGAKMAYELRSLAEHMDERVRPLKTALEKLSRDDARILRESRGPDRSYWFELYHDMYATIVDDWKIRYLKFRRRLNLARTASAVLVGFPVTVLLLAAIFNWIIYPARYERTLQAFQSKIGGSNLAQQQGFTEAVVAYVTLKNTSGYGQRAKSLWAEILARQAQWYETTDDPGSALLCLLKAAAMEADAAKSKRHLKDAEILLGTDANDLLTTYCYDCDSAVLSPDGQTVLTIDVNGQPRIFHALSGKPLDAPFCDFCSGARIKGIFSSDGTLVLIAATGSTEAVSSAPNERRTDRASAPSDRKAGGETPGLPDEQSRSSVALTVWETLPVVDPAANTVERRARTGRIVLKESKPARQTTATKSGTDSASVGQDNVGVSLVKAFALVGSKFWFAGTKGREFYVWDDHGTGQPLAPIRSASGTTTFSRDGQYLLTTALGQPPMVWRVTADRLIPYPIAELNSATLATLSPDGHSLLIAQKDKTVRLLDLASKAIRITLPAFSKPVRSLAFSPSGEQFLTRINNPVTAVLVRVGETRPATEEIQVWNASTGQALFPARSLIFYPSRISLGPEGKTLLRLDNQQPFVIEKWDAQTGQLLALMRRGVIRNPPMLSADGNTVLFSQERTARLWSLNSGLTDRRVLQANIGDGTINDDGRVLATIGPDSRIQFWNVDSGSTIGQSVAQTAEPVQISHDGKYAASEDSDQISVSEVGKPNPLLSLPFSDEINVIDLSPDNKLLAVGSGPTIKVWNVPSGTEIGLAEQHSDHVNDVAVNGQHMISGSDDRTARIWDFTTGRSKVLPHAGKVVSVAISADGKLALTGTEEGMLQLWDIEKGVPLGGPIKYEGAISTLTFSHDGHLAVALTADWMYLCAVDESGLHYLRGTLISEQTETQFGISQDGQKFRFVYPGGPEHAQVWDLDMSGDPTTLKGDPSERLREWEYKLGLLITELGKIENLWPAPQGPSANPKEQKKADEQKNAGEQKKQGR